MKVLTPGHLYELANFDTHDTRRDQQLQFIHKEPVDAGAGSTVLETVTNGTTNEEVLSVLIDRMQFLQSKFPCRENAIAITKLDEALMWLEKRTADRVKRNVEGKHER
jgi:cobalamin biosynthesis protein CbiD